MSTASTVGAWARSRSPKASPGVSPPARVLVLQKSGALSTVLGEESFPTAPTMSRGATSFSSKVRLMVGAISGSASTVTTDALPSFFAAAVAR